MKTIFINSTPEVYKAQFNAIIEVLKKYDLDLNDDTYIEIAHECLGEVYLAVETEYRS
jgi:hypothetical protein